jgi:hypothetical protein
MTVGEIKKALANYDDDLEVMVYDGKELHHTEQLTDIDDQATQETRPVIEV